MSYLRPPYFKAQTIADGIKMMTPTTWPVVIGFATTATLLLYAHSKLATNPAVRAKSLYLAQLEGRDPHAHEAHAPAGGHDLQGPAVANGVPAVHGTPVGRHQH